MNPQFDLVMSLLNVPKNARHAWPHLTQRSRAATGLHVMFCYYSVCWHLGKTKENFSIAGVGYIRFY
jgi:hypothetical protein